MGQIKFQRALKKNNIVHNISLHDKNAHLIFVEEEGKYYDQGKMLPLSTPWLWARCKHVKNVLNIYIYILQYIVT